MYTFKPAYPTPQHARAADFIADFFSSNEEVRAVLLTCSCARGQATPDSCLDIAVLVESVVHVTRLAELERCWASVYPEHRVFRELARVGRYAHVDLDFVEGGFAPGDHGWTTGPDAFELGIGNLLVYSAPLWEAGDYLAELKARWLPYYAEGLRRERLALVRQYCLNNLEHIPGYVDRGLYFQSLHRLWHALGEFLQALFIARRVYPIAYDKWIREQVVEILGLPELYAALPGLFELQHLESGELTQKARQLTALVERYLPAEAPVTAAA